MRLKQAPKKEFLMEANKIVSSNYANIRKAAIWQNELELIMHESCGKYSSIQLIEKS